MWEDDNASVSFSFTTFFTIRGNGGFRDNVTCLQESDVSQQSQKYKCQILHYKFVFQGKKSSYHNQSYYHLLKENFSSSHYNHFALSLNPHYQMLERGKNSTFLSLNGHNSKKPFAMTIVASDKIASNSFSLSIKLMPLVWNNISSPWQVCLDLPKCNIKNYVYNNDGKKRQIHFKRYKGEKRERNYKPLRVIEYKTSHFIKHKKTKMVWG